jgi:uncharacterized protein DUF1844
MDDQHEGERGFKVTDRRRFSETGTARAEDEPTESAAQPSPAPPAPSQIDEGPETMEVNFLSFVLGLGTQALLHLGDMENPVSHRIERDLDAAKQVIDLLGILREKTRNNLEPTEEAMLDSTLYDLRMRYVELVRGSKEGA